MRFCRWVYITTALNFCLSGCSDTTHGTTSSNDSNWADTPQTVTSDASASNNSITPSVSASDDTSDLSAPIDSPFDATQQGPFANDDSTWIDPTQYCERSATQFCRYYLRCNRIAANPETCEAVFLETCNARFEPIYTALADAELLRLSRQGFDECGRHLEEVDCATQIFDLDQGCSSMWRGFSIEGDPCGPGIESFICAEGLSCILGPNFCGECRMNAYAGEPCGDDSSCNGPYHCEAQTCQPRSLPGTVCENSRTCVVGATCINGRCAAPERVGLGQPCDRLRRCPYKSRCISGVCVETAALNETCFDEPGCMSGFCDSMCVPLKSPGDYLPR